MSDPVKIPAALEEDHMYHWEVTYELQVDASKLELSDIEGEEILPDDPLIWVSDTLIVSGTEDGQYAITKAFNHSNSEDAELKSLGFRVTGLKLLSTADI
mgnify:CR=1 FL=1